MSTLAINRPTRRHLVWLPAALLVAFGAFSAAGFTVAPDSVASTATGTVSVNAAVAAEVHMTLAACTTPNAAAMGGSANNQTAAFSSVALTTTDGPTVLGQCDMTFGTNNQSTGAQLTVADSRPAGGTNNFLCASAVGTACSGNDFTDTAVGVALADGAAGLKFSAMTCTGATTMNTTNYYPVAASSNVCVDNTGATDSTLTLQVVANPSTTQPAGSYFAQANFVATA